ncbi:DUF2157 domain-containing protein, partial [Anabaena sp. CA = ATCC 33047]|uniref:DUF2157 domain-containing protein n=1 Tax=Anabaena sp. (strain CA / ATCC 33047) TaxID=52271 RepID=UPI001E58DD74
AVSGLALWVVTQRLQRYSRQFDLLLLFSIGLQATWLGWRLVPSGWQQLAVTLGTQLTHSQNEPWALLSVVLFPYLLMMVVVIERLRQANKRELSHFGEIVNLLFGTCLTTIATVNPSLRSLNLLLSTITLVVVSKRRYRLPVPLVYLTHTMAVLTFSSIINWLFPNLALHLWACILLVLMVAEWGYSLSYSLSQDLANPTPTNVETFHATSLHIPPSQQGVRGLGENLWQLVTQWRYSQSNSLPENLENPSPNLSPTRREALNIPPSLAGKGVRGLGENLWRDSAWYMGFALAAVSFVLLWINTAPAWQSLTNTPNYWGLIWLTTPVTLTILASRTTQQRTVNSMVSVLTVGVAQLLTLPYPGTRLIGLAVGAGVMYADGRYLRSRQVAGVTIGLGLGFIAALLWQGLPGVPRLAIPGWYVVGAIATIGLWLGKTALSRRNDELSGIYAAVSDQWAIALCSVELTLMTLHSALVYQGDVTAGFWYFIATTITLTAIIYRSWRQPTDWAFYGIGWGVELLVAEVLGFGEHSIMRIAIANIALGLFSQILGEWWRRRYQLTRLPRSFHILPLMYGAFSVILRLSTFTDWSGLCSLGVALIFVGVGRRNRDLKPLLYLGIIGVSVSAYELLFYQMLQTSGGGLGDGLIAMAALGTSIMTVYRVLAPWLGTWLRLTPQELQGIAHLHWVWSSGLLMGAVMLPIEVNRMVGLGTGAFLISYAILQGKQTANENQPLVFGRIPAADLWVYLGFLLVGGMRVYWRETAVGELLAGSLVPWNGAIACVFAYFLYILPWQRWRWSKQPWQIAAYILPLVVLAEIRLQVYPITLVIAAGYYIFLAKIRENIRFTYITVALIDWALFLWLDSLRLTDGLWYVTIISLSLLYLAQVDPALRQPENKLPRHTFRIIVSGVICGWAILFNQNTPLIPGGFALIAIFAGLALRVRAFLTVGTGAFFITSIYQLVIFSLRYPFLKWVVGLLLGIALISIAANFETHRTQITSLLRNTSNEFEEWE